MLFRFESGLWLGHWKIFLLGFFVPSKGGLSVCFGPLSYCITQVELQGTKCWLGILLQDFLVERQIYGLSRLEAAPLCLTAGMKCCVSLLSYVT